MICETFVKKYCCEDISKIENYDKAASDMTQMWECHHKMELIKTGAVVDSTRQDLIGWGIYFNRPADELIFLTRAEHNILHKKGKKYSDEARKRMSVARKGKKLGPQSNEHRRKLSEARKGMHWKLVDGKHIYYR